MKEYIVVDVDKSGNSAKLDKYAEQGYVVREVIQGFYQGDRMFVAPKIIMERERPVEVAKVITHRPSPYETTVALL